MYLNAAASRMRLDFHQDGKAAYLHAHIDWDDTGKTLVCKLRSIRYCEKETETKCCLTP